MVSRPPSKIYHSSVTWKVFNFFNGMLFMNNSFRSSEFITNFNVPIKWTLTVNGRFNQEEPYESGVHLQRSPSCSGPRYVNVKVSFTWFDNHGNHYGKITGETEFIRTGEMHVLSPLLYKYITSYSNNTFTNSGAVTIKCDLLHATSSDIDTDLQFLSSNLNRFCASGNLTDLDIMVDGKTISVHRAIVKSRSPYVARILNENSNVRQIDLTGKCSIDEINSLIEYWYTGDLGKLSMLPPSNFWRFIRNMEQQELQQYVHSEDILITTTLGKIPRSIRWEIIDFNFCEKLKNIKSNVFSKYTLENDSWKLHIYPKGHSGYDYKISLCVEEVAEIPSIRPIYLEVFFIDSSGKEYGCKKTVSWIHSDGKYEFNNFMTHDEFIREQKTLLMGGVLRIGCRADYSIDAAQNTEPVVDSEGADVAVEHPYTVLANDLKTLYESGDMSDFTLRTLEGKFKVHAPILAARSRYFELLLNNRELDANKDLSIRVDDIETEDLDMILKYMYYAEKPNLNMELALRLYPVVRRYKIKVLQGLCSDYLQSQLTVDNAIHFIALGHKFWDCSLEPAALKIIYTNWDHISKTKEWQNLKNDNAKLASKLISGIQILSGI